MRKELQRHVSIKPGRRRVVFISALLIIIFVFYIVSWFDDVMFSTADLHKHPWKSRNTSQIMHVTRVEMITNPHNYKYLINPSRTCENINHSDVYLMVVVCGAPSNFEQRTTIRETWGSIVKHNNEVRLIFMIGNTLNKTINEKIMKESNKYNDIVKESFIDSYKNLSTKSVAMLKWTSTYCKKTKYLAKVDDDMFINIPYLLKILRDKKITNSIIGMKITGAKPIQNKNNKWYTPKEMFNGDVYPPYCSGTSYVISGDIVSSLYHVALITKEFWLEDIYITGICREKIKANVVMDWGFTYSKRKVSACAYKSAVTGHENTPAEIRKIWSEFKNKSLRC